MSNRLFALIVAFFVVAPAVILEFVLDIRTPVSQQTAAEGGLATAGIPQPEFDRISASLKSRFPNAVTSIWGDHVLARVDGRPVADEAAKTRFIVFEGLSIIGEGKAASTFPFSFGPDTRPSTAANGFAGIMKMMMQPFFAPNSLDFENHEVAIGPCLKVPRRELDLPIAGPLLALGNTALCVVESRRNAPRRMLVGVVVAENGLWLRSFARGTCRILAQAWLAKMQNEFGGEYVRCIVADRPDYFPWGTATFSQTFAIENGRLARMTVVDGRAAKPKTPASASEKIAATASGSRIPAFAQIDPANPALQGAGGDQPDPERDALRRTLFDTALLLRRTPCDDAARKAYVQAMIAYARSWSAVLPCYGKALWDKCSDAQRQLHTKNLDLFGLPREVGLDIAVQGAHRHGVIVNSDFPAELAAYVFELTDDDSIGPAATQQSKEQAAWRRSQLTCNGTRTAK